MRLEELTDFKKSIKTSNYKEIYIILTPNIDVQSVEELHSGILIGFQCLILIYLLF